MPSLSCPSQSGVWTDGWEDRWAEVVGKTSSQTPGYCIPQACAARQVGTDIRQGLSAPINARCDSQFFGRSSYGAMGNHRSHLLMYRIQKEQAGLAVKNVFSRTADPELQSAPCSGPSGLTPALPAQKPVAPDM